MSSAPDRPRRSPRGLGWLRRLYDWTLHWAHTRFATPALAVLSFAESSFFPVPPDVLVIALAAGRPRRAFWYATVATAFSVLGGLFGYWLGMAFMDSIGNAILELYHLSDKFEVVQDRYRRAAFVAVFTAGLTPIPYKVFTLAAGAAEIALGTFTVASILGRGTRFFAVAGLLFFFGPPIRDFIERYFDRLAIAFTILLIGGFFLVRALLH